MSVTLRCAIVVPELVAARVAAQDLRLGPAR
jgi:hypothetical protein